MSVFAGKRIHFIGVGGASMRALAEFCIEMGATVSGSDKSADSLPARLVGLGAAVYAGSRREIIAQADAVVYSSAVPFDDDELSRARELHIPAFERQDFLAYVASGFSECVAVAGTHGKTTVTAMLAHVLAECGIPFVAHIGGEPYGMGNLTVNRGADGKIPHGLFVTEACEYKRNLLALHPSLAVITNMECDHPDCYADIGEVYGVFAKFVEKCPVTVLREEDAFVCTNAHIDIREHRAADDGQSPCGGNAPANGKSGFADGKENACCDSHCGDRETYARGSICTYGVSGILECADGQTVKVVCPDGRVRGIALQLGGRHFAVDAVLAYAAAVQLGADAERAAAALGTFRGVKRRYERSGRLCGANVIFDYAHHPTEIACTLAVAKKEGRILVVFQPHTFSRTLRYMSDFVRVLGECDNLVLMPTYAARECGTQGATELDLAREIKDKFPKNEVYVAKSHDETWNYVKKRAREFDAVIFLGAGDVYALKDRITPEII